MLDSVFHVKLGTMRYRLAEDAEGAHYILRREPARNPNAVVVQGDDQFQSRSDTLVWNITDWSGGEGRRVYDNGVPNQHHRIRGADPFRVPGTLEAGPAAQRTGANGGGDFNEEVILVIGQNSSNEEEVWAVSRVTASRYYIWDGVDWGAAQTITSGPAAIPTADGIDHDGDYLYYMENNTQFLWRWDGTTATQMTDGGMTNSTVHAVRELGGYVYIFRPNSHAVWEVDKADTFPVSAPTEIDSEPPAKLALQGNTGMIAVGPNRLYVALDYPGRTAIREITPTTAAGTGFGKEIASFEGVRCTGLWWHNGRLMVAIIGTGNPHAEQESALLYIGADGTYGSIGKVNPDDPGEDLNGFIQGTRAMDLLSSYFIFNRSGATASTHHAHLYQLDSVSGGYAGLVEFEDAQQKFRLPVRFNKQLFVGNHDETSDYVYEMTPGEYASSFTFISAANDFGVVEDKIFTTLTLRADVPANWSLAVSYETDLSETFTSIGTMSASEDPEKTFNVSTLSSTVNFGLLAIKVVATWSGGGVPTTTPTIYGVEPRAVVNKQVRVWELMLDMYDDAGEMAGESLDGASRIANIEALAQKTVIEFEDGYQSRDPSTSEASIDVVLDEYAFNLSHAGEGTCNVKLIEVT